MEAGHRFQSSSPSVSSQKQSPRRLHGGTTELTNRLRGLAESQQEYRGGGRAEECH